MKGFKNKISRFGSLISLIALCAMITLFVINFPIFMSSDLGQIFAGIWSGFAIIMFVTHTVRLLSERRQSALIVSPGHKDARTRKNVPRVRAMRS